MCVKAKGFDEFENGRMELSAVRLFSMPSSLLIPQRRDSFCIGRPTWHDSYCVNKVEWKIDLENILTSQFELKPLGI